MGFSDFLDLYIAIEANGPDGWRDISRVDDSNCLGVSPRNEVEDIIQVLETRNYIFFSILGAGIGNAPKAAISHGFPNDISCEAKVDGNLVSASWNFRYITLDKLLEYPWNDIYENRIDKLPVQTYAQALASQYEALHKLKSYGEVRLVYAFI